MSEKIKNVNEENLISFANCVKTSLTQTLNEAKQYSDTTLNIAKTYTDNVAAQKTQVQIITWEDSD